MTMKTLTAVEARRHDAGGKGVISDRTLIFYVTTTRVTYTTAASFTPNSPLAAKLSSLCRSFSLSSLPSTPRA